MAALLTRASRVIPGGVLGFHKLMAPELFPAFAKGARGAEVEDLEGRRYVDYILGKGPVLLGHGHPRVQAAVRAQMEAGNMLGLSTADQVEVAEGLLRWFPHADQVRFHKTGSDACSGAVRLARVTTGREWIVSAGYHGWHDWCSVGAVGVPDSLARCVDFGYDLDRLEAALARLDGQVAAIFVEPQPGHLEADFYRTLRDLADAHGALLLMDEVKTGLRMIGGSVQAAVGVAADLTVLSKSIANGYCLSAVLGRRAVMAASERTHISTTYDVEAIPYAAARATLEVLGEPGRFEALDRTGMTIVDGLNTIFARLELGAKAFGPGAMFRIAFAEAAREERFFAQLAAHGILMYPHDNQFVSIAHDGGLLTRTLKTAEHVLTIDCESTRPSISYEDVCDWTISRFPNRKGFLRGAPLPSGRAK